MSESLISLLKSNYQNWKFISRTPDERVTDSDDIIESVPMTGESPKPHIKIGKDYDTIYFIDGSESRYIVASAEEIQNQQPMSYPIAIGQTSVVACRLNLSTGEFRTAECKEQIVIAVPSILDKKEHEISWKNNYNGKEKVLIVNYDEVNNRTNLFEVARESIHKKMRSDEDLILKNCLKNLTEEQKPLIIIDGKFQSSVPAMSPVLSINKKFDYTRLPYDTREAIQRIKDDNNKQMWSAPRLINGSTSVWYVRLRDKDCYFNNTEPLEMNAGIVECALLGNFTNNSTKIIKSCSYLLRKLANPTCYNLDKNRWRTHLYHMYLTEKTCKQKLISKSSLMRLIYG